MSVLLKSYVDASGELVYFRENGDNDTLAASDSTLTRVQGGDITVSDDLTLNEDMDGVTAIADALQLQITANDLDIADNVADILALQVANTGLQTQITDNDNDIAALETEQVVQNSNISQNATDIAQEIVDRQAADTAIQGQVLGNGADIVTLQSDITTLQAQDTAFNAEQAAQDALILANTAKVSFEEAPNDGQQYARQNESWQLVVGGGGGITPPSSTDNAIVRFDGTAGQVQNSNVFIDDAGRVGIGISAPEREFHINDGNFRIDRTGNSTSLWFVRKEVGGAILKSFRLDNDAFGSNDGQFTISDVGTQVSGSAVPRFRIENDGNIDVFLNRIQNVGLPIEIDDAVPVRLLDTVKVRNTATGNLNAGVTTFNNFTTVDQLGSTFGQFNFATNGITPNFTGVVRVDFNVELFGNATRAVVGFRWAHNGNVGPWVRHTYIRNASGHSETSANFSTVIPVIAGQAIQIQHDNFAGGGTVTSPANGVEFIIQRIR